MGRLVSVLWNKCIRCKTITYVHCPLSTLSQNLPHNPRICLAEPSGSGEPHELLLAARLDYTAIYPCSKITMQSGMVRVFVGSLCLPFECSDTTLCGPLSARLVSINSFPSDVSPPDKQSPRQRGDGGRFVVFEGKSDNAFGSRYLLRPPWCDENP